MLFQKNVAATRGVSRSEQREVALLSEVWVPIAATIASIFAMVNMPILTIQGNSWLYNATSFGEK